MKRKLSEHQSDPSPTLPVERGGRITATDGRDMWRHEREAAAEGCAVVAGIDEAGRGPLAGPVVAACVVLPDGFIESGIDDSKKLTEIQRERAFERICRYAIAVGIGVVHAETIDGINILQATHCAMREAAENMEPHVEISMILVDGLPVRGLPSPRVKALVGGDAHSISIAAASIVAKVTRDRMMILMDGRYPGYGFANHKGYGAATHLAALRRLGPTPIHRRTFAPVAAVCHPTLRYDAS